MRVAIEALLLSSQRTGVGRCILELGRYLSREETEAEFLYYAPGGLELPGLPSGGVRVLRCRGTRWRPWRILWQHFFLPWSAKWRRADLVHGTGYVLPWAGRKPSVVTIYDLIALQHRGFANCCNRWHFRLMLPRSVRRADRIIVNSDAVRQDLIETFQVPESKIRLIPLGLEPKFRPSTPAEAGRFRQEHSLPERFFLYLGNLEPKKNIPSLLRAFFALKKDGGLAHKLVIVGKLGWRHRRIFQWIRDLNLEEDVIFLGFLPDEDVPVVYSLADVFVFPTFAEGFGLPPLESMACGTPVITSDLPTMRETTGGHAVHVDPHDLRALVEAMRRLAEDRSERDRLREEGLAWAKDFTWERHVQQTLEVYREVLAEHAAGT